MKTYFNKQPRVAVITSTIGRKELERAILSVQAQTYPCKHYIFVDGEQYAESAKAILSEYHHSNSNIIVTYLPMNTGANGWTNSSINAIAPFLVQEEVICYLDDDNWYDPNHVETSVKILLETGADYAYALRKLYDDNQNYLCEDVTESIGHYENKIGDKLPLSLAFNNATVSLELGITKEKHIDTNCYVMRHSTAKEIALNWHSGFWNDTNVFEALNQKRLVGKCTNVFSVNYVIDLMKYNPSSQDVLLNDFGFSPEMAIKIGYELVKLMNRENMVLLGGKYPWEVTSSE